CGRSLRQYPAPLRFDRQEWPRAKRPHLSPSPRSEQRQNFECRTDFTSRVDFVPIAPPSHLLPSAASSPVAPACWPRGEILPHPSARSALHSSPQNGAPQRENDRFCSGTAAAVVLRTDPDASRPPRPPRISLRRPPLRHRLHLHPGRRLKSSDRTHRTSALHPSPQSGGPKGDI